MLGIMISACLLMVLVKVVAKEDAESEFWPMAGVALISVLASFGAGVAFSEAVGEFSFLIGGLVLVPTLMWIAKITFKQSAIVTGLYVLVQVGLHFLLFQVCSGVR